jgi:predicted  nucleic acid-binding Zn-ribbon protein
MRSSIIAFDPHTGQLQSTCPSCGCRLAIPLELHAADDQPDTQQTDEDRRKAVAENLRLRDSHEAAKRQQRRDRRRRER